MGSTHTHERFACVVMHNASHHVVAELLDGEIVVVICSDVYYIRDTDALSKFTEDLRWLAGKQLIGRLSR